MEKSPFVMKMHEFNAEYHPEGFRRIDQDGRTAGGQVR